MNKVKLLCAAILLLACVGAQAQQNWIQGFYERHGDGDYTLTKVHTQGILIDGKTDLKDKTFRGGMYSITCGNIPADMVRFSFEKADFNCNNPKITFQYWDEDINDWKTDVEACKGQAEGKSTKDMVMMLVLDYSS